MDLVYKRVLLSELVERCGLETPLLRAVGAGAVCMVNPARSKILHKKASLAVLSDERNAHLFDVEERAAIMAHIPWTRVVEERQTEHGGRPVDLVPFILEDRTQMVLKPNDDYGGAGIVLGWQIEPAVWERAVAQRSASPHIVQRRVSIPSEPYPSLVEGRPVLADRMLDTAPFVCWGDYAEGCLTRALHRHSAECHGGRRIDRTRRSWSSGGSSLRKETGMQPPSLTLGVEEEYQIIDPATRELHLLYHSNPAGGPSLPGAGQARAPSVDRRGGHQGLSNPGGSPERTGEPPGRCDRARGPERTQDRGSRHPSLLLLDHQEITPLERYLGVKEDMQDLAQRLLIFGTHVHIGIEDRDFLIDALNVSRYFLPHILCLSTSSPFWNGRNTGLKSYRSVVFRGFPRTGVPRISPAGRTSRITWRPSPAPAAFPMVPRSGGMSDPTGIIPPSSSGSATCALESTRRSVWPPSCRRSSPSSGGCGGTTSPSGYIRGPDRGEQVAGCPIRPVGQADRFRRQQELPAAELIRELLEWFIADVVDELGSRTEVEYAYRILEGGTSADRQLATFKRTGDLKNVVDQLIAETEEGVVAGTSRGEAAFARGSEGMSPL